MAWKSTHARGRSPDLKLNIGDFAVFSDNVTVFVEAAHEFRKRLREEDWVALCEQLACEQKIWKLIPSGAEEIGGFWERLVRRLKMAMFFALGNRRPTLPLLIFTIFLVEPANNLIIDASECWSSKSSSTNVETFLSRRPSAAEPCLPNYIRYVDCREMLKPTIRWSRKDERKKNFPSGVFDLNGFLSRKVLC